MKITNEQFLVAELLLKGYLANSNQEAIGFTLPFMNLLASHLQFKNSLDMAQEGRRLSFHRRQDDTSYDH